MIAIFAISIISQLVSPYQQRVYLDSDGQFVIFARYYLGEFVCVDSVKTLADYLEESQSKYGKSLLLDELKKDLIQQGGYASEGLFGTFEIPLPKGGFSDFMGETGKLDVGGYVKITLGGSRTFISNLPEEQGTSWFPELEMKQEMAINLDGQVGDRMRVFIDHNSERINESQNKITVTYTGREDEIIQEIEGGDTQLSIPATTYTGDIPSHSGLFGIKSKAKFGPLDIVAIASKEQTQTEEVEIEGSVQTAADTINAKYYERRRIFWLGTYEDIYNLEVYVDDNTPQNDLLGHTYYGRAYLDVDDDNIPDDTTNASNKSTGFFTLQRAGFGEYYRFIPSENVIELLYNIPSQQVLGVRYSWIVGNDTFHVGSLENDTLQLKLICPKTTDASSYTWNYEKKNYYQVVSPGSRLDSLRIYRIITGGEHTDKQGDEPFINLLGLDSDRDGKVDENTVFLTHLGLLRFPDPQPFASDTLEFQDDEIYTNPDYMQGESDYYMYVKTTESKPVYTLPANVETVFVYIDDVLQTQGEDYHVDFDGGKLEFNKPILPNQKVRIKAEYSPFFSAAEKSLVGLRGTLRPFGDAMLGTSFFWRNESYPAEHVRLREEPFNRTVWEVDFSYPQKMPFLTRVIDWLPLVKTETESHMNMNFEGAYSFSNLNAKGEVYLDDLESTTIISNDVSINRTSWVLCSQPAGRDTAQYVMNRLIWYNPRDQERLQADDIYEDPLDPNEITDVLKIVLRPDDTLSFCGLTQYVYTENYDEVENLELIIKGKGGNVHVDLAHEINEDQLRRNKDGTLVGLSMLDDEDKDRMNVWTQQSEDTGLDTLYGDDDSYTSGSADDGNDDYDPYGYTGRINGTELNKIWDTEDINRNGQLDDINRYFSFSFDIDDTTQTSSYVHEAGLVEGWKMFRISIKDTTKQDTVVGQPDWHTIQYVRIWFDGFAETETLYIYKLSGTGSRWKNNGIVDGKQPPSPNEKFSLTPVNTKTHTGYYRSPYPEEQDEFGQVKSEGGLELRLENIEHGHTCVAHRRTDTNEDYRAYDTLSFYIQAHNTNPLVAFRIGSDSLNYYEYRVQYEDGAGAWNDYRLFSLSMQHFLDLKMQKQETEADSISDSSYAVVGNPSLSKNQFLEIRISNTYLTPLTDTFWFNDVKLVSPKTDVGRIFRGNGQLKLADFGQVTFAYDESNGRFKRLSESKDISTQSANRNYLFTSTVQANKILPESWYFNIPISYSYRKTLSEPRFFYFADDIELSGDNVDEYRTKNTVKTYAVSISKSNSKHWLFKNTIDRIALSHDRTQSFSRAAKSTDTTDIKNIRGSYSLDPKWDFSVLKQKISLLPKNISISALYTDNSVESFYRESVEDTFAPSPYGGNQQRRTLTPSLSLTYSPHIMLSATYTFSQSRDSVGTRGRFGEEVSRNQTLNTSLSRDLKIISPRLTFNSTYTEDYRFEIRQNDDLRNVNNSGRYGIDGQVNVSGILQFIARLRDETKDTLITAGSPAWIAKQLESLAKSLQNPLLSYSRQRNSSYLNVKVRPDPVYQWGLVDSIPEDDVAEGSYPGRNTMDTYSISSGLNTKLVNVSGRYNGMVNRTFSYANEIKTMTTSYPNVILRINHLESLPFLKKICLTSTLTSGFNQTYDEKYELVDDSSTLLSDSKTIDLNPVVNWTTSWVKKISTSIDVTYSESNGASYALTDTVPTKRISRGGSASISYTFSAPRGLGIPLLKGLKFTSNLSFSLGANYSRTTSYTSNLTLPISDISTLGANIGLSYNFSSSITGGANVDYSQNKDINSDQDTRRVGVNFWVNINF
jgi:hypothetical protein